MLPWERRGPLGAAEGVRPRERISCVGVGQARAVAERGAGRDRHRALDPPQRLEGLDHGGAAPGVAPLLAVLGPPLEACGGLGDRPPVLLEDARWCWRRTDDCRGPSGRHGAPMGLALWRRSWRRSKAVRRSFAAVRSRMLSSRARRRARMASSSTWGTSTGVRSPERVSRASWQASRRRAVAEVGYGPGHDVQPCLRAGLTPDFARPITSAEPQRGLFRRRLH